MDDTAVGISIHTGWAVVVAVTGMAPAVEVLHRERIPLVDPALPRQVFHAAADQSPAAAAQLIRRVERSAEVHAHQALDAVRLAIHGQGHRLAAMALCSEPRELPADVTMILTNHARIHAAEGELYRAALELAAERHGLPILQVAANRVGSTVTDLLGLAPDGQVAMLASLGKQLGPPWQVDHKRATLLAAVALAEVPRPAGSQRAHRRGGSGAGGSAGNDRRNTCVA